MSQKELEERTGIPERTWEGWRYRGEGPPFYRIGQRAVRYKWDEVEAWIARSNPQATAC
jgi:predicted DNA-binding transcriptional regulator AlpA